ncbi:MAG: tripartite tricarboxylate transporter substrate-binding protein [Comamonadaceae bacterium]|nr:ABC transporter substrate-binding protein [Burkholderiales bacterium]MEB2349737.1 tripartite tricarboxylate transporter substrate-binding protein [Comamonadaceae bacterium]
MQRRFALQAVAATCATPLLAPTRAQGNLLRVVVPYAPGGSSDRAARIVAEKLGPRLGRTVVVENKPGAGGRVALQQLKGTRAGQDALVIANPATIVVAPLVFKDQTGYDPHKDFQPIAQVTEYEFGIAVSDAVPVKELSQLLEWLQAHPTQANFGVPATGSLPHFFALMTAEAAKVRAEVVGYKGSGPLLTDLIGGQVPAAVDTLDTMLTQHDAGKLRILASSGTKRSPFAPKVPTCKEAGLDLAATGWNAFFAPASMPAQRAQQLSSAIRDVMRDEDTRTKLRDTMVDPVARDAAETTAMLQAFRAQWEPVVQRSGYQP